MSADVDAVLARALSTVLDRKSGLYSCTECRNTHTRLTTLCLGLPGWAGTSKVKPIWILLKQETVSGSGISWAVCKSATRSRQITTPAPHHSSFLQAGCSSCRPTNSVKALKATSTEGHCVSQLFNNFLLRFRWGFTRGLCCRCGLPVRPSVCLSQAGVVSKQIGGSSWFLACRLFIIHTLLYGNGQVSLKIRLLLSGTFSQGLRRFRNVGKSIVVSTKLVDGRACISHLRRRTRRCWTHVVYYTSVDVMPWLFYFDLLNHSGFKWRKGRLSFGTQWLQLDHMQHMDTVVQQLTVFWLT